MRSLNTFLLQAVLSLRHTDIILNLNKKQLFKKRNSLFNLKGEILFGKIISTKKLFHPII